jgi:CubicO group peptidase (beta-lactamase class C family)
VSELAICHQRGQLLPTGVCDTNSTTKKVTHNNTVREPFLLTPRISGMFRPLAVVCPLALSLFIAIAPAQQVPPGNSFPKGIVWSPSLTGKSQIDSAALDALYADMEKDQHHDLKGIVIVRNGVLLSEHYFNGDSATTLRDIRSATKSLTSLLMGIAIDKQIVHGVDDPISQYLPGLPKDGKEKITIKDLLNMRSGLDADDENPATPGNKDRLDESSDWNKTVYAVPMKRAPGEKYLYCLVNAFLTGAIIENATKTSLDDFAQTNLFAPLNIQNFRWRHVPVNRTTGQGNLEITARAGSRNIAKR